MVTVNVAVTFGHTELVEAAVLKAEAVMRYVGSLVTPVLYAEAVMKYDGSILTPVLYAKPVLVSEALEDKLEGSATAFENAVPSDIDGLLSE